MSFKLFCLWVFVLIGRPQDLLPVLQPLRPALILATITLSFVFFKTSLAEWSSLFKIYEAKKYMFFYLVMILGIPFAYHRKIAFDFTFSAYIVNISFFLIFLLEVNSIKRLKAVNLIISLSAFLYSIFGLAKGSFSSGRFFIYGSMFDPNDIAYVLISLFPLSIFYLVHNEGLFKKIFAAIGIGAAISVVLLSASRGGILGLITVFALILFTRMERINWSYKAAFLTGVIIIFLLYNEKINMERYLTLTKIEGDYNVTVESGRLQIWERAFQLIQSNPITGVGVNCFGMAIGYLRQELFLIPEWQAAHNSYIQVATETGLIGFAFFFSIIIASLKNFLKIKNLRVSSQESHELKTLAGLLTVGFAGSLITAFFLSQGYSILFTLFFAFSAALRNLQNSARFDIKDEALNKFRGL